MLGLGIFLFFGIHLLSTFKTSRTFAVDLLQQALGVQLAPERVEKIYKILFTVISVLGLVLIIIGYSSASTFYYQNSPQSIAGLKHAMVIPFILVASTHLNGYLRAFFKHPMLIGTALWAAFHLYANGSLHAILFFGAFLLYSLLSLAIHFFWRKPAASNANDANDANDANAQNADPQNAEPKAKARKPKIKYDILALIVGSVFFVAIFTSHGFLFGVSLIGQAF